jgi:hypothetical protein
LGYKKIDYVGSGEQDYRSHLTKIDNGDFVLPAGDGWSVGPYGFPRFDQSTVRAGGVVEQLEAEQVYQNPGAFGDSPCGGVPLDLTDASNSHKISNRPESYGRQGMTGYGKKMIRSACAILERAYKGRLTFATVTMPPLPLEQRIALAECWPEFVRQALQWLSRRLEKSGLPTAVCSVSEIQPTRLQADNGGYLHLHMVWPNRRARKGCWAIEVQEFRAWCESFLLRRGLLPDESWVNVDTQRVTKSAAAYLSKYMSKGGEVLEQFVAENGWSACPGQWWNLTKTMRDAVKREVCKGENVGLLLESFIDYLFATSDFSAFWACRTVDMEYDGRFIAVGYCGILKSEHVSWIQSSIKLCAA